MPQLGQVQPSKYMQINIKKDNGGWVKKKKKTTSWASPVVQCLRIRLAMQGTWI